MKITLSFLWSSNAYSTVQPWAHVSYREPICIQKNTMVQRLALSCNITELICPKFLNTFRAFCVMLISSHDLNVYILNALHSCNCECLQCPHLWRKKPTDRSWTFPSP
ncbi:hypothetical protein XENTR_v10004997 [Xenopus tropicalis]|nr:hypothetical protein XENTR_v10004997 [Xenopus tropicalis]